MALTHKIVTTGPESSGKSVLCQELSVYYDAPWVPEYARHYLEIHGPDYDFTAFRKMLRGHLQRQASAAASRPPLLFLDTDLINYVIWARWVFDRLPQELERALPKEGDHRYLLTYPDLPWAHDPLRENPEERLTLFQAHRQLIEELDRPYAVIYGSGEERLNSARRALREWGITDH